MAKTAHHGHCAKADRALRSQQQLLQAWSACSIDQQGAQEAQEGAGSLQSAPGNHPRHYLPYCRQIHLLAN
ncbi:hypothetical protein L208DRAFT_1513151 [Tricholoma matsutake]|nr:hypothetical protein L208DRAFT_1513151 [Tricholoma matsutake 945]